MTIRNQDGTVFQLKKPNPLLKTQDMPGDEHVVHNFAVQEVLVRYTKKKKPLAPNGAVVSTPTLPPALEEQPQAPAPTVTDLKPMPLPKVVEHEATFESPEQKAELIQEEDDYMDDDEAAQDVVSCWCLPGEYRQHIDNLYGETRLNLVWGDKFLLEGVILQSTEMNFVIWAQVKIGPPSIIYIRSQRRWWRVTDVQPHDNGFAMSCLPSETRPSFD
jgi:hypothetical protein